LAFGQCARYFVAAIFKELALISIREMWGLDLGLEVRSRLLWQSLGLEVWTRSRSQRLRSRLQHWFVHIAHKIIFYYTEAILMRREHRNNAPTTPA